MKTLLEIKQAVQDLMKDRSHDRQKRKDGIIRYIQEIEMAAASDPNFMTLHDIRELRGYISQLQRKS